MTTWTIEQLKQAGYNVSSAIIKPKNKYNNKVTHIGNLRFDSKKEYEYYLKLLSLKKAFTTEKGEKVKPIRYRADFVVTYANGTEEVVDVKGMKTRVYINKRKQLLKKYPNINFKEV
jgi:hypothetical protein|nr:MAG TPA: Endonuclease [Caudoviricetes sp.]